jgi:V-type H+-transporting ATPase subunit F
VRPSPADEDTVTGFLLAGVGNVDSKRKSNFLVVDSKTSQNDIEEAFRRFTNPDAKPAIGVLLLAQSVAGEIRHLLEEYNQIIPAILEIPTKDHPYDAGSDYLLQRVKRLTGAE